MKRQRASEAEYLKFINDLHVAAYGESYEERVKKAEAKLAETEAKIEAEAEAKIAKAEAKIAKAEAKIEAETEAKIAKAEAKIEAEAKAKLAKAEAEKRMLIQKLVQVSDLTDEQIAEVYSLDLEIIKKIRDSLSN